ncbi:MAG: hypothetical protein HYV90_01070 [Candidatus Woesebacteria bacterium]|nr:MAG: hypothetical protein HYV90_01070 [Candidatus Woesebacteria bacterium]
MNNTLAQINLFPSGGFKGFGKLGLETDAATSADRVFTNFISSAIGLITIIAIIWFVFLVTTGSFAFMTAGGDKQSLETARKKIMNGLVGLMVCIFGIFVVRFIGYLIGIPDILNFVSLFSLLTGNNVP